MPSHRTSRQGWFGRGRTRALLSLGLLVGMGAVATSAYWTAEDTVSPSAVSSGSLHIDLDGRNQVKPENFALAFNLSNLSANESRSRTLQVKNNSVGPVKLSYKVRGTATGDLGAQLRMTVTRAGAVGPGGTCTGTSTPVAGAALDNVARPATGLELAPGASETLCIAVSRTNAALGNGLTSDVTLKFDAMQVQ